MQPPDWNAGRLTRRSYKARREHCTKWALAELGASPQLGSWADGLRQRAATLQRALALSLLLLAAVSLGSLLHSPDGARCASCGVAADAAQQQGVITIKDSQSGAEQYAVMKQGSTYRALDQQFPAGAEIGLLPPAVSTKIGDVGDQEGTSQSAQQVIMSAAGQQQHVAPADCPTCSCSEAALSSCEAALRWCRAENLAAAELDSHKEGEDAQMTPAGACEMLPTTADSSGVQWLLVASLAGNGLLLALRVCQWWAPQTAPKHLLNGTAALVEAKVMMQHAPQQYPPDDAIAPAPAGPVEQMTASPTAPAKEATFDALPLKIREGGSHGNIRAGLPSVHIKKEQQGAASPASAPATPASCLRPHPATAVPTTTPHTAAAGSKPQPQLDGLLCSSDEADPAYKKLPYPRHGAPAADVPTGNAQPRVPARTASMLVLRLQVVSRRMLLLHQQALSRHDLLARALGAAGVLGGAALRLHCTAKLAEVRVGAAEAAAANAQQQMDAQLRRMQAALGALAAIALDKSKHTEGVSQQLATVQAEPLANGAANGQRQTPSMHATTQTEVQGSRGTDSANANACEQGDNVRAVAGAADGWVAEFLDGGNSAARCSACWQPASEAEPLVGADQILQLQRQLAEAEARITWSEGELEQQLLVETELRDQLDSLATLRSSPAAGAKPPGLLPTSSAASANIDFQLRRTLGQNEAAREQLREAAAEGRALQRKLQEAAGKEAALRRKQAEAAAGASALRVQLSEAQALERALGHQLIAAQADLTGVQEELEGVTSARASLGAQLDVSANELALDAAEAGRLQGFIDGSEVTAEALALAMQGAAELNAALAHATRLTARLVAQQQLGTARQAAAQLPEVTAAMQRAELAEARAADLKVQLAKANQLIGGLHEELSQREAEVQDLWERLSQEQYTEEGLCTEDAAELEARQAAALLLMEQRLAWVEARNVQLTADLEQATSSLAAQQPVSAALSTAAAMSPAAESSGDGNAPANGNLQGATYEGGSVPLGGVEGQAMNGGVEQLTSSEGAHAEEECCSSSGSPVNGSASPSDAQHQRRSQRRVSFLLNGDSVASGLVSDDSGALPSAAGPHVAVSHMAASPDESSSGIVQQLAASLLESPLSSHALLMNSDGESVTASPQRLPY